KAAGKWEDELRTGIVQVSKVTWLQFRERYESDVLALAAPATDRKVQGIFDSIERILNPIRLRDVDANRISHLQAKLAEGSKDKPGLKQSTIKTHLAHLQAALRWAVRVGFLPKAPAITMPKRAKGA